MKTHQIQIFISHSWNYSKHYDTLSDWIFKENWSIKKHTNKELINFVDMSIPKEDPIHNARNSYELRSAIFNEINKSHIVVIPTGMYANYSKWIKEEIDGANKYNRPIIAVNPWGQEKKSSVVLNSATTDVGWNKQSVIDIIWRQYAEKY